MGRWPSIDRRWAEKCDRDYGTGDLTMDFYAVRDAYIACALWSTNADHLDPEGSGAAGSLEDHYSAGDLDSSAMATVNETVQSFLATADRDALDYWSEVLGDEQIGHDLWLTQNGHGAGFWDRFSGGHEGERFGQLLTDHAHPYGEVWLHAGDDGRLYI